MSAPRSFGVTLLASMAQVSRDEVLIAVADGILKVYAMTRHGPLICSASAQRWIKSLKEDNKG